MMQKVKEVLGEFYPELDCLPPIDIAHNYAATEHHFGKEVMVHRKGATRGVKVIMYEGRTTKKAFVPVPMGREEN